MLDFEMKTHRIVQGALVLALLAGIIFLIIGIYTPAFKNEQAFRTALEQAKEPISTEAYQNLKREHFTEKYKRLDTGLCFILLSIWLLVLTNGRLFPPAPRSIWQAESQALLAFIYSSIGIFLDIYLEFYRESFSPHSDSILVGIAQQAPLVLFLGIIGSLQGFWCRSVPKKLIPSPRELIAAKINPFLGLVFLLHIPALILALVARNPFHLPGLILFANLHAGILSNRTAFKTSKRAETTSEHFA